MSSPEFQAYEKLLNSQPENERYYQMLIISHSLFSQTHYLVYNSLSVMANLPTGELVTFQPVNFDSVNALNTNDLDQSASFTLPDVNNILDNELDNIPLDNEEPIVCAYAIYHSDYLNSPVEYIEYEVNEIPHKKGLFTMKVGAPDLNADQTGEIFDYDRFPMLRGL